MKNFSKLPLYFILICLFILPLTSIAQSNKLSAQLDEKENKKIESSQKLIKKGNSILLESEEYEKEVEALKNADGRIKTKKINKLNKKIAENKMKAAVYFEDGYNKHIKTLDGRLKGLEKAGNSEAEKVRDEVKQLQKKAQKQYNKAERLSSPDEMVELVELAQENQNKAIEIQESSLLKILAAGTTVAIVEEVIEEEPVASNEALVQDSISHEPEPVNQSPVAENLELEANPDLTTPNVVDPNAALVVAGAGVGAAAIITTPTEETETSQVPIEEEEASPEIIQEEVITKPIVESQVFLSIQFLADKQQASSEKLKQAYAGNMEVIEMIGDGWYRYSIGKFTDVETARNTMKDESIKGFIVAYNKEERISVREAMELLKQ
ncbi:hypothetical protein [Carboxylicivirga sp. N1Y90]|uniref:hypothetical protein n=1 Tax=Carboxylicivirga fragile TaxID=3417571 RepID=UPI003D33CE6A|nr:hypothetical protein [Marinilabiliaceae bacterium N1Y90]